MTEDTDDKTRPETPTAHQNGAESAEPASRTPLRLLPKPILQGAPGYEVYEEVDDSVLTIDMEQASRLIGEPLHSEVRDGKWGCANNRGSCWVPITRGRDGALRISVYGAVLLSCDKNTFLRHVIDILYEETHERLHTQESLEDVLLLCEALVPDRRGWVDARALYSFLQEELVWYPPYRWWCERIAYFVDQCPTTRFRHTSLHAALREGEKLGTPEAKHPFRVEATLALRIALASPTPRGGLLRGSVLNLERALTCSIDTCQRG